MKVLRNGRERVIKVNIGELPQEEALEHALAGAVWAH